MNFGSSSKMLFKYKTDKNERIHFLLNYKYSTIIIFQSGIPWSLLRVEHPLRPVCRWNGRLQQSLPWQSEELQRMHGGEFNLFFFYSVLYALKTMIEFLSYKKTLKSKSNY